MSFKRHLIAFDMDGTLLTDKEKIIDGKTKQYLIELSKQGHIIILASGRPRSELMPYYKELNLNTPLVCFNGIHCFNPNDKNFKQIAKTYPKEWLFDIIKQLKGRSLTNAFVEDGENVWMLEKDEELYKKMWPHGSERDIIYGDFEKTLSRNPMTLITICKGIKCDEELYKNVVKKYKKGNYRFWWNSTCGEIFFGKISKAECLEKIRKYYRIKRKNTIAFGDYTNDIEMIKWANIGVAMANAHDDLKKVATIITSKDNNNNGIEITLKEIMKNRNT